MDSYHQVSYALKTKTHRRRYKMLSSKQIQPLHAVYVYTVFGTSSHKKEREWGEGEISQREG
jgi:hypothetical protein